MKVLSQRSQNAAAELAPVADFFLRSSYGEARSAAGACDFTFGNPHEMPLAGLVEALAQNIHPQKPEWFAYKTSEPESQSFIAEALSRQAIPLQRKPAISDSTVNIRRWRHALFTEATPVKAFAALNVPILYMLGDQSPESAHAVARILVPVLPKVCVVEFPGLGHMGPVTHPDVVNAEIARFLTEDQSA